ncbi:MAG: hypothetical protein AAGC55_15625, partial [Myxococcota bacterium]
VNATSALTAPVMVSADMLATAIRFLGVGLVASISALTMTGAVSAEVAFTSTGAANARFQVVTIAVRTARLSHRVAISPEYLIFGHIFSTSGGGIVHDAHERLCHTLILMDFGLRNLDGFDRDFLVHIHVAAGGQKHGKGKNCGSKFIHGGQAR